MITLYTAPTGNGYRASIMLEETGLAYRAVRIDFASGEQKRAEFLSVNPVGKIPAIVDDEADGGAIAIGESLAIALYLSEKAKKLMPSTLADRARAWHWGAAVVAGLGAAFTGVFFSRATDEAAHGKIIGKFLEEADVHLTALDRNLADHRYLSGAEYSFADVLAIPTILRTAALFDTDFTAYPSVVRWRDEVATRPAVIAGMAVPA